ncbi:MAG TPA: flagellar assembly protein FliW [Nitrospira sp.]|nr:flagellar assembly protein FliW [Nitrospira sp.]
MICTSTRFGRFEVNEESIVTFPSGLLGFLDQRRYVILDHDTDAPFKWLQSVDEPGLAFVIIDPADVASGYSIKFLPETLAEIHATEQDPLSVAVILTIPSEDPAAVTANLRGPLVMNRRTRLGKQVVLADGYPTRHPVFPTGASAGESVAGMHAAACP